MLGKNFDWIIEIGFLPGVTDNAGKTAREAIGDSLRKKFSDNEDVYSSQVFLITGSLKKEEVLQIAATMYNPLIQIANIFSVDEIKKEIPPYMPKVILRKSANPVIQVDLNVSDNELIEIGNKGIADPDGTRRGPLALDLISMKTIQEYFKKLGRNPTDIELESLAQTWSEHCKHTIFSNPIDAKGLQIKDGLYKTYIKGATNEIRKRKGGKDFCVSVFSDNAGGIIFDEKYLITHKVETHNSPSALDPFGGAITGIVGVNRDTIGFGLGAKPVANVFGFCFGYPDDTKEFYRDRARTQKMLSSRRIIDGVIKGINAGGNCSGIPTVSGFLRFDERFRGKPLVFAGTVGLIPRKIGSKLSHEKSARPGDYVVVTGGRVGADGIHGATFSSVVMDSASPATAVQIGDPITQKKMGDAIVKEARDQNLYTSITDNGAGGISCSVAEMAKECGGFIVDIDKVPLKYPGLDPWQIWISESQERMTLSVPKTKWPAFKKLMDNRGVEATVVGVFTKSGKCIVRNKRKVIMDVALAFLHDGLPKRALVAETVAHNHKNPELPKGIDRTDALLALLKDGNVGGFKWVSEQYDHEVQAGSIIKPLEGRGKVNTDAQVFSPVLSSKKGVVVATGVYPSYSDISTYAMASCALDTAVRNAIAAGGTLSQLAILDNFCWCSSYDTARLGELVSAVKACYDTALCYETPFISGKDSMFNDFKGYDNKGDPVAISIPPTLLISAISVIPDAEKTVTPDFKISGDAIYILGETHDELGASEYYKMLSRKEKNNAIGNDVPMVNVKKNKKTYLALERAIQKGLVASSVSLVSGGLAVALAKSAVGGGLGFAVTLKKIPGTASTTDAQLFSESQGRILVTVAKKNISAFEKTMKGVACAKIGSVSDKDICIITGKKGKKVVSTNIKKLSGAYHYFSDQFSK